MSDKAFAELIDSKGNIQFIDWKVLKLEGYWDQEVVDFLNVVAKFVEGEVIFLYEEVYFFKLTFFNGVVHKLKAETDWEANKPEVLKAVED